MILAHFQDAKTGVMPCQHRPHQNHPGQRGLTLKSLERPGRTTPVLVALGATAATYLLGSRQPLAGLRGRVHAYRGAQLIVTYHPAYLLRDPRQKKEAWADLQIAMKELGLKAQKRNNSGTLT